MAKPTLKQEDLVLNIIVNGNKAQSDIGKVSRALRDSKSAADAVENEMKLLEKQGLKNSKRYRELSTELTKHRTEVDRNQKELTRLNQSLKLEDQSIGTLERSLRNLIRLRKQSVPNSAQYKEYTRQIEIVSGRLNELRQQGTRTAGVLSRIGGGIRNFFSSTLGGIASVTALVMGIRRATDEFSRFDDTIADVMKTTNAAKEEVMGLNSELEKIDTRTSQEDLLGLARIGGKLGISDMEELRGFVESSNQLIVALNEDLGGDVEGTVNAVGKLVEIFGIADTVGMETGLLKVGSAINELGMASTANEGYMVEFARRMAGVAPLAGITVEQILGLGATLDQLGQTSEVSSTALSKLFLKLASDAESFAKYAGMEVTAFKELLEKDFMAAFTAVLNGVRDNSDGINELASTLGDLGLDGGRVIGVLGSLANNTGILTHQIDLANEAFEKGTSLTEEYNIKNQTAAAQLEKARKEVSKFWRELGERLFPAITAGNNLLVVFLRTIIEIIRFVSENYRWIATLTAAIVAYSIAVNAATIATNAKAIALRTAAAAQRLLNVAVAANPIGLLVAAIAAAATALALYSRRLTEAEFAQKQLNDAEQESERISRSQTSAIERYTGVLQDETRSRDDKLAAVKNLRDIMPGVLQDYTDEEIMAGKATQAIKEQTKAIILQARIRARQEKIQELEAKRLAAESGDFGFWDTVQIRTAGVFGGAGQAARTAAGITISEIRNIDQAITDLTEGILDAQGELNEMYRANPAINPTTGVVVPSSGPSKEEQKAAERAKKAADAKAERERKAQEKLLEQQKDYQAEVLKNSKSLREQEDIEHQERLKKAGLFGLDRQTLTKHQLAVLEALEKQHQDNINKLDTEAMKKGIEERQNAFQDQLTDLRIRNNEELAQVRTLEQAKAKLSATLSAEALRQIKTLNQAKRILQSQHQQQEADLTRQHLEELRSLMQSVLDSGEWEGINLADKILSPEEKKLLEDKLREVREQLAKLRNPDQTDLAEDKAAKVDILGMSMTDWETLFANLEAGKIGVQDVANALLAMNQIWAQYNALVAAGEKRRLQEYEEANDRKKDLLKKRLDAETISQESYNRQIEKLDKDMAKKRARMEYDQAKRERNIAISNAIANTAVAVTKVLAQGGIAGIVLAAVVGAMGALQLATIMRQPLPSLAGREDGGYLVRRSQDGKKFNATYDPAKRGYVHRPTVITGEDGSEFVASNQAVQNPSVKPVLDIIDTAQRNGTISTLRLEKVLPRGREIRASIPGRQSGGAILQAPSTSVSSAELSAMNLTIERANKTMDRLERTIANGIEAKVALIGKDGFYEKDAEYKSIQKNANL